MMLDPTKSLCEANQQIIVSKDDGEKRMHRALNKQKRYCVRQYKLDGGIVLRQTCCDFLLLNDTLRNAYFIELKGGNIDDAIPQLEAGYERFRSELGKYNFYFRIVSSKVRTHNVQKNRFRKFKDKWGSHLQYKENILEEKL